MCSGERTPWESGKEQAAGFRGGGGQTRNELPLQCCGSRRSVILESVAGGEGG